MGLRIENCSSTSLGFLEIKEIRKGGELLL